MESMSVEYSSITPRLADDIDLIDEDVSSLQRQIELIKKAAEQAGLILNINRTETMVFADRNFESRIQVIGETVESVEKFQYLFR